MKATSDTVPKVVDKDACDVPAIEICVSIMGTS